MTSVIITSTVFYSGLAANAVRGGDSHEHVRQGQDQRQLVIALPQHQVLRAKALTGGSSHSSSFVSFTDVFSSFHFITEFPDQKK